ncbi:MAG: immunoglobulin domain-containing protein [Verrucomicrobiota bacterium]
MKLSARFVYSLLLTGILFCLGTLPVARAQNISLVSQREPNTNSTISYGDTWGEGNIACLGIWLGYSTSYGVGIYDISNPSAPVLQSIYSSPTSSHNQFELGAVRNKIGYFGSWSGGGVHIVSLTNMALPTLLAQIGLVGGGFDKVHTVFLERNFLYEAAHVAGVNTVKVINVTNPSAPSFVRNIVCTNAYKVHQITTVKKGTNTILYTSDFGNGGSSPGQTDFWDVSNVGTQPAIWLGRILSGGSSHSSWPTPDGNTLVVCRETPGGDVRLYDISTPTNLVLQCAISPATMGLPAAIPHNPVIVSNLLFLSWYQNGLQIFDISNRTRPVRIGSYDTFPSPTTNSFQGNWGIFPNLGLNKLLVSDINSGFYILDASAISTATNNYPLLLVTQPTSFTATQGMSATISSLVTGSSPKFQWFFNGGIIPNATNTDLVFNNVQTNNSGNYFVIATNSLGSVTSAVASMSVAAPAGLVPTITAQPMNAAVYAEDSAMFSVGVSGSAPFTYQWRFNGGNIFNETNATLTLSNVQPGQAGSYSVFISNSYDSILSSNATLSIIDSPYLNSVEATPGARSALISWKSTVPAQSQVLFGATDDINPSFNRTSYIDRKVSTNHTIFLTGLDAGTRYSFQVISSTETNSYLSGVYRFTTAGTIILDNPDALYTGAWTAGSTSSDKFGTNYQFANYSTGSLTATATYQPNLPTSGNYDVHIWYPLGGNRANNAPHTIFFNGGSNTIPVNQQINGGFWQSLTNGVNFLGGTSGSVRIANNANPSVVMADGVKFTYVEAQDFPTNQTVPAWWKNFYFSGAINPLADPDSDGYSTAEEYILGTSPLDAASKLQMDIQSAGTSANIVFWPYLGNRSYVLQFRPDVETGWQNLSPGTINSTPYGDGIFTLSTANSASGLYRLLVQPSTNSLFSGSRALPKGEGLPVFSEAACGMNRIYVK